MRTCPSTTRRDATATVRRAAQQLHSGLESAAPSRTQSQKGHQGTVEPQRRSPSHRQRRFPKGWRGVAEPTVAEGYAEPPRGPRLTLCYDRGSRVRAVLLPEYKGSFERRIPSGARVLGVLDSAVWRELIIHAALDLQRATDYLATRDDIDAGKIAYYGLSLGAGAGGIMTAVEPRFAASILHRGEREPVGGVVVALDAHQLADDAAAAVTLEVHDQAPRSRR